jgi:hypothetical protein
LSDSSFLAAPQVQRLAGRGGPVIVGTIAPYHGFGQVMYGRCGCLFALPHGALAGKRRSKMEKPINVWKTPAWNSETMVTGAIGVTIGCGRRSSGARLEGVRSVVVLVEA